MTRFLRHVRTVSGVALTLVACSSMGQSPVTTQLLKDFEDGTVGGAAKLTTSNSTVAFSDTGGVLSNVTDGGSKRLKIESNDGGANGCVITIPGALAEAGNWLVTADVKVVSTATGAAGGIDSFGLAVKTGLPSNTVKVPDMNAGYVMNLYDNATNSAALGYQTIAAAVQKTGAGAEDLTIYFSSDPSKADDSGLLAGDTKISTTDGNHRGTHRVSAQDTSSWASNAGTHYVLIDNIRLVGPGNFGEDRVFWLSVFDNVYTQAGLESLLTSAKNNNFNTVVVQARYRADRSYRKNRDFSTYSNPEPAFNATVDTTFDPIQYAIDRGRELGLRVYAAWSLFLVTDGHDSYPDLAAGGFLPNNTRTYYYNDSGSPVLQTTAHDPEGVWMDPGYSETRTYNINVAMDFLQNYDVDGIIWDRVRYSDDEFGYSPNALTEMGYAPGASPLNADATFRARRQQAISTFMKDVYTSATTMKPWLVMGAAPIAYLDDLTDTYRTVFQAWPKWNSEKVSTRVHSFGALDLNMPQFYRQWNSSGIYAAPASNQRLMLRAAFGDITADSALRDTGCMPGAYMNVSPLFLFNSSDGATTSTNIANQIAQNMCDIRGNGTTVYPLNGSGIYRGGRLTTSEYGSTNMTRLRAASTSCGTDVLATAAAPSDFLMKAGYDRTAPNSVTGASVTGGQGQASLSWTPPAAAVDGDGASRYLIYRVTSAQHSSDGNTVKAYYANLRNRATTVTGTGYTDTGVPAGTYYYSIVPVDDYNNRGAAVNVGPVTVTSPDVVIESCVGTTINTTTFNGTTRMYQELNASDQNITFTGGIGDGYTTSKSSATNPAVTATRSRISSTIGQKAIFRPNVSVSGYYNIYITLDDSSSGPSNNANANYTISHYGGSTNGSIRLFTGSPGGTSGLANQWKLLTATPVPLKVGENNSIVLTNVDGGSSTQRFCMDAVWFQFVTADPLPVTVSDWAVE